MSKHEEMEVLSKIAKRSVELAKQYGFEYRYLDALMDISYAHEDIPIKLDELLSTDDANFGHDVFGIRLHLNRRTLKIENCFVPRYSAPVTD